MTSHPPRHLRRPRAEAYLLPVPPLVLHHRVDSEDRKEVQEAAALSSAATAATSGRALTPSSAPTPTKHRLNMPTCPSCGHRSKVHYWQWWAERACFIYHCGHVHDHSGNNQSTAPLLEVCGRMWIEAHRGGYCFVCHRRAEIQKHGGTLGYWCTHCQDLAQ